MIVEIQIRGFFTSEEADIAPSISVRLPEEKLADVNHPVDWSALVKTVKDQIAGFPMADLREMTSAEVEAFVLEERDDYED